MNFFFSIDEILLFNYFSGKKYYSYPFIKIDVYGNASDELKDFVKPFGLPFYFHNSYAMFSRG